MASATDEAAEYAAPLPPRPAAEVADYFAAEGYRAGFSGNGTGDEVRIHAPLFTFLDLRRLRRQGWAVARIGASDVSAVKVVAKPAEEVGHRGR